MSIPNPMSVPHGASIAPVGAVCAFAGDIAAAGSNPTPATILEAQGWMLCDGRALRISQCPDLYAVLGDLYGDDGEGTFRIPDYRGLFLRGVDYDSKRDPDVGKRTPAPNGVADGPGSLQSDALQNHEHIYKLPTVATVGEAKSAASGPTTQDQLTAGGPTDSIPPPGDVRVSVETRSKNIYVNYIIKFR